MSEPVADDRVHLAVDRDGERYTEHSFARGGDPWRGATILTPGVIADLRKRGLLPLTEITTPPASDTTP